MTWGLSTVAAAAGAVPDQIVAAVLGLEELGEDCGREARVVELHREVGPVVLGVLFPGCANFDFADEDAVGGGIAAGVFFRDDPD